jgi:hypothetical protein
VESGRLRDARRPEFGRVHEQHRGERRRQPAPGLDISGYTGAAKVILTAMKKYGMLLADNGSNWFVSGTSDPRFDDNNLNTLKAVPGSAFEVVKLGTIYH